MTDLCHSGQGFSLNGCAGGLEPGWEERSGDSAGKPDSLLKISSTLFLLVSLFNVCGAACEGIARTVGTPFSGEDSWLGLSDPWLCHV